MIFLVLILDTLLFCSVNKATFCGTNALLPSSTLGITESWGRLKTDFKGEIVGFKIEEGEERKNTLLPAPLTCPSSPSFFWGLLRWWLWSIYLWAFKKKCQLCRLVITVKPHLVEYITNIRLWLSKPHSQQLRSFNRNKVGLTLICNGFSQECFTAAWRSIKQHTLGWHHSKLEELVWMFYRVLHQFLQFTLDIFQATNVVPCCGRYLYHGLTQSWRVGHTHGILSGQNV